MGEPDPRAPGAPLEIRERRRIGGGDLNESWWVRLADGREAFMKTRPDVGPHEFANEAGGLRWLARAGGLPTPEVLEVDAGHLMLEWVQQGQLDADGEARLGQGLATIHRAGAPCFGLARPGADPGADPGGDPGRGPCRGPGAVASFGSLQLSNEPAADWSSFYAERRLLPLARAARDRGRLSRAGAGAVEDVCGRIQRLCGPQEPPARLHGDLWAGNVLADRRGHPWLIDPSAYGGHREVDLAMLRLFGAPSQRTFAAYQDSFALADGWSERVRLWQLAPLLVHAALFGGHYGDAAERVAREYTA